MKQQRDSFLVTLLSFSLLLLDLAHAALSFEEDHSFLRYHELNTRILKGQKKEKKRKKLILIICLSVGISILFCVILVVGVWYYHRHYVGGGLTHIAVAVADAINGEPASTQQSTNYHCQEHNGTIAYVRALPLSSYHQRQISYNNDTMSGSGTNNGASLPSSQKCESNGQQVRGQSNSSKTKHYVTQRPPR